MKRVKRRVYSATSPFDDKISFKPTEVLQLLSQIEELKNKDMSIEEAPSGNMQFVIDNAIYEIAVDTLSSAI